MLQAEDRRAPTASDLAVIRSGARSGDPQTARIGVRALGRLERPSLIPDILPALRHPLPEVRAEAANAIGQAAQGWKREPSAAAASTLDSALGALASRLEADNDPDVRAAVSETAGRLPYVKAEQVERAERLLLEAAARGETITDRLGVAKGYEALIRLSRKLQPPSAESIGVLKRLAVPGQSDAAVGTRIRRLALEALITAQEADETFVATVARDPDAQVRRLAMRAATSTVLMNGLTDDSPVVRIEALRQLKSAPADRACAAAVLATGDRNTHVVLTAIDQLAACTGSADALDVLNRAVADPPADPRGWHRAAHAIVALAGVSRDAAGRVLPQFVASRTWQLRMYAARAAATLQNRSALEKLAADQDDNVREAAVTALSELVGHAADAVFIEQLGRSGNQVLRAAALALADTPRTGDAVPALKATLARLVSEGRDNSHDARAAIEKALASVGGADARGTRTNGAAARGETTVPSARAAAASGPSEIDADDLRRLASPRARVTMRGIGTFELALFTVQAPATVLRFARLADAGYYNGLTFHRVVPNFVIQGGSPGANEYVGDARFMRDELGLWPHVRGAVGISTRGRDTGDAQIFVDLVDNPRLDHEYTVFAQVLNGIDVVDQILEGDIIERIEIVP